MHRQHSRNQLSVVLENRNQSQRIPIDHLPRCRYDPVPEMAAHWLLSLHKDYNQSYESCATKPQPRGVPQESQR